MAPALLTTVPCLSSSDRNMADNSVIILALQANTFTMMVPVSQPVTIPIKLLLEVAKIIVISLAQVGCTFITIRPVTRPASGHCYHAISQ